MLFPFKLVCSGTKWKRIRYHGNIPSWRRFQGLSQDVLKTSCKTKNCYAEDVFKTSWRHVLKTSWRDVLKTYWRHTLKTSSRRLGGKQNFYWWYLYLTNLNFFSFFTANDLTPLEYSSSKSIKLLILSFLHVCMRPHVFLHNHIKFFFFSFFFCIFLQLPLIQLFLLS